MQVAILKQTFQIASKIQFVVVAYNSDQDLCFTSQDFLEGGCLLTDFLPPRIINVMTTFYIDCQESFSLYITLTSTNYKLSSFTQYM